jgi:hypothetical protein
VTWQSTKTAVQTCTSYSKYGESLNKETAKVLKKKAGRLDKNLVYERSLDHRVTDYRDRLVAEVKATPVSAKLTKNK